jgi:hypothetical protein
LKFYNAEMGQPTFQHTPKRQGYATVMPQNVCSTFRTCEANVLDVNNRMYARKIALLYCLQRRTQKPNPTLQIVS